MSTFKDVTDALGALVEEKNAAYGDATRTGAEAMKALYPNGVTPEQYERFGYCLLVWHKLSRLATKPDAFGENPIHDIAGYSVLALAREKERAALAAEEEMPEGFACQDANKPNGGMGDAFLATSRKAKEFPDGTLFGVTAASYQKFKDGKVLESELVCPDCKKTMAGSTPEQSKYRCWTCFFIKYPASLGDVSDKWKRAANARELEEVPRLFVMGKTDDGSPVVGSLPRPSLGTRFAPFEDLSKRWDAGVFEGTGKGYTPPSVPARPGRLGTYRGPLWAAVKTYKVGDAVSAGMALPEFRAKYPGYWRGDKRKEMGRFWVITGVL